MNDRKTLTINGHPITYLTSHQSLSSITQLIPATSTALNKLADVNFVNSSINAVAAFYITKNSLGEPFQTYAELTSATTFYCGGSLRVPTLNDYCLVQNDEHHTTEQGNPTTRYLYQGGTYPSGQWSFLYIVNNSGFTAAQYAAINSGITSLKVSDIDTIKSNYATKAYVDVSIDDLSGTYKTGPQISAIVSSMIETDITNVLNGTY